MKKSFTLIELLVVIIIIGILATLGFIQYTRVIEKGRIAEARTNLGALRTQQVAYYQEKGAYAQVSAAKDDLACGLPRGVCNTSYFFNYTCSSSTGTCTATRCTGGGKSPNYTVPTGGTTYQITLDVNGNWGGTTGFF